MKTTREYLTWVEEENLIRALQGEMITWLEFFELWRKLDEKVDRLINS